MLFLAAPIVIYRFEHPHKSETQLFIEIPDAYIHFVAKLFKGKF